MLIEFYGKECGHCLAMHSLIERLEKDLGVTVERMETWHDPENEKKREAASGGVCPGVPMFVNTDTGQILCGESSYEELLAWAKGRK